MKIIELLGTSGLPAGPDQLMGLVPDEHAAGSHWTNGVVNKWSDDLADIRQDIYTMEDGQSLTAHR